MEAFVEVAVAKDKVSRIVEELRALRGIPSPNHPGTGENHDEAAKAGKDGSVLDTDREAELQWTEVQGFDSLQEALRCIMTCWPIDFRPQECEAWPKFEHEKDALAHVLAMQPPPVSFVSIKGEYKRRLRIRHTRTATLSKDSEPSSPPKPESNSRIGHRSKKIVDRLRKVTQDRQRTPEKPFIVEASGSLFERMDPRDIKDKDRDRPTKFYVAVQPDAVDKVLSEGWKSRNRVSIPCAATAPDALQAFSRVEDRRQGSGSSMMKAGELVAGRGAPSHPIVLAVTPRPGVDDVVAHREVPGGFLLRPWGRLPLEERPKESGCLPKECFCRKKVAGDGY